MPKIEVMFNWPEPALDVLMRHRFLHIAYAVTSDRQWVYVSVVDDRGEMDKVTAYMASGSDLDLVKTVWAQSRAYAEAANVEWRVSVLRVGVTSKIELEGA